jgi:hypothetical protein
MVPAGRRVADSLALTFALLFLIPAAPGAAQTARVPAETSAAADASGGVDLAARAQALEQWIDAFKHWQRVRDQKLARRYVPKIDPKPSPPDWLFDDCQALVRDDTGIWTEACQLLVEWQDDPATAQIRRDRASARSQAEVPTNTTWWQHVHLDGLWPMTQTGASVYGIIGTHVTVNVSGRWEVSIAPGAMLLTLPGPRGARDWKIATDWGVSYRLTDFVLPGTHRPAHLHVNFVTAWVLGGPSNVVPSRIALAGLSITLGRKSP